MTPPLDRGQQCPGGFLAFPPDGLVDRGQRWIDVCRQVDIVEPDDADIAGNIETQVA